ncbi:putative lipid II flippase FtsW [Candidatus Wolfebacteria bacterium]|nr:MAG: putative lipid II flippase FtsW [Candidatus Wolfebacteria bacterium]
MRVTNKPVDKFFLGIVITLISIGVLVFVSASLGILPKNTSKFYGVLFNQLVLGLGVGIGAIILFSKIHYKFWRKYSFYIFLGAIIATLMVFIPGLGFTHGGARRWLSIGPVSVQPVEFLKIAFIIYFAGWLSWVKNRVHVFKFGILPFAILMGIIAAVLFVQPDTKNFLLILLVALAMFVASGVKWKYILGLVAVALIGIIILVSMKPYLLTRVKTFVDPSSDPTGASYQIQQSLIAIGSGGVFGRGYGQSIQKFSYLPEPQGDSIFAVVGEEFGFVGSTFIILLYVVFAFRGLRIAYRAPDLFSRLLVTGIVILIVAQSFLNIASIIGVFPLTGVPLVFMSHGGTSLLLSMAAVGIVLNISRYQKKVN